MASPPTEDWRHGVAGLLVTPFDAADRLSPARLLPLLARGAAAGIAAWVVHDDIGECDALRAAEAAALQAALPALLAGRAPVVAGLGRNLPVAVTLARRAAGDGAAAVLVPQPTGPHVAPRGIIAHVARIADATPLPILFRLHAPGIGLPAIEALLRIPGLAGIVWASADLMALSAAITRAPASVAFLCGLGEAWAPAMTAMGARGLASSLANLAPARAVGLHAALTAGERNAARAQLAALAPFAALRAEEQGGAEVAVLKAALALISEPVGAARPPAAWPLPPGSAAGLRALLAAWGLGRPG